MLLYSCRDSIISKEVGALFVKPPSIVAGEVVPCSVYEKAAQEEKEKKQRRHEWAIAIFGVIGGGIMGFVSSLIFWLCTK